MKQKNGLKIFYACMLVIGSAIGAGVLALPVIAGRAGLIPGIFVSIISYFMMGASAWIMGRKYIENKHMQSLQNFYEKTLGKQGKYMANSLFVLLSVLLMIAYIKGMGDSLSEVLGLTGIYAKISIVSIWVIFTILMFCRSYIGIINSFLVILKTVLFFVLLIPCFRDFNSENVQFANWAYTSTLFPIFLGAFNFHGTIPAICKQAENTKNLFYALVIGLTITLLIYLAFLIGTLCVLPRTGDRISLEYAYANGLPITIVLGYFFSSSKIFSYIGLGLPIIAMSTSFIGVTEGLTQFIQDGLQKIKNKNYILSVLLPIVLGLIFLNGDSFVQAMIWVGIIIGLLFGLLPCLAWLKDAIKTKSKLGILISTIFAVLFGISVILELYAKFV